MKKILTIISLLIFISLCVKADMQTATNALNSKNYKKAFKEFLSEAKKGNADAMNYVGGLYSAGLGCKQNYQKAVLWYQKAIKKNNYAAMNNMANLYCVGNGLKKDNKKAFLLFKEAADNGSLKAQSILGTIYYTGTLGQKINYNKAFNFMNKAAEDGLPSAQMGLGTFYAEGKALKQDYQQAYMWYYIAYKNGEERASEGIEQTSPHLTKSQINTAKQQANSWIKDHKAIDTALTSVQNGITIPIN